MSLTVRDKKLLEGAARGLSANELSEMTGLPAERCKLRVDELLEEKNVCTDVQQRQLYLHELNALKSQLQDEITKYGLDNKTATVLLNTLKAIGDVVTQSEKITADQLRVITEAQGRALMLLCSEAFIYARQELERYYPDVNVLQIETAFTNGLRKRAGELNERNA